MSDTTPSSTSEILFSTAEEIPRASTWYLLAFACDCVEHDKVDFFLFASRACFRSPLAAGKIILPSLSRTLQILLHHRYCCRCMAKALPGGNLMRTVVEPSPLRLSILKRTRARVWPGEIPAGRPSGRLEGAICQGI